MLQIADAIDLVLESPEDDAKIAEAKAIALSLCEAHPLPYWWI